MSGITALWALYLIAAWAIITNIFQIAATFRLRKQITNEWLLILGGVATVLFGLLIAVMPGAGALEEEKTFEIQIAGKRIYITPYATVEFEYQREDEEEEVEIEVNRKSNVTYLRRTR